jgi:hypothetical protein
MTQIKNLKSIQPINLLLPNIRYQVVTSIDDAKVLAVMEIRYFKELVVVEMDCVEIGQLAE